MVKEQGIGKEIIKNLKKQTSRQSSDSREIHSKMSLGVSTSQDVLGAYAVLFYKARPPQSYATSSLCLQLNTFALQCFSVCVSVSCRPSVGVSISSSCSGTKAVCTKARMFYTVNQTASETGKLPIQYRLSPVLFQAGHIP